MIPPQALPFPIRGRLRLTHVRQLVVSNSRKVWMSWVIVLEWARVVSGSGMVWRVFLPHRADLWFMYVPSGTMLIDNN